MFNWKERQKRIKNLRAHRKEFRRVEKEVLGKNVRSFTHDLDKLLGYYMLLPIPWIRKRHKLKARHHQASTKKDYIEKIIDFECARFSKPKSPLTAREYIMSPGFRNIIISRDDLMKIVEKLGL
jgi:hypothetical protein